MHKENSTVVIFLCLTCKNLLKIIKNQLKTLELKLKI